MVPPSTVESQYQFLSDVDLQNLNNEINAIKTDDLLKLLDGLPLRRLIGIGSLCAQINQHYLAGSLSGEIIDFALTQFLLGALNIGIDDSVLIIAFRIAFGEVFSVDLTQKAIERTAARIQEGAPVIGIGSIAEKLDGEEQQQFLPAVEMLERLHGQKKVGDKGITALAAPKLIEAPDNIGVGKGSLETSRLSLPTNSLFMLEDGLTATPAESWLIPGIIPANRFFLIHGPAGCGKTTAATQIADRVIAATERPVIYINVEGKHGDIDQKKRRLSVPSSMFLSVKPVENFSIFQETHLAEVVKMIEAVNEQSAKPVAMIIVDSLFAATGGDLNKGVVGAAASAFNRMASTLSCSFLLIHHNNKSPAEGQRKIFGSALIAGAVVVAFELQLVESCEYVRKMVVTKSNLQELCLNDKIIIGQYPGHEPVLYMPEDDEDVIDRSSLNKQEICRRVIVEHLQGGERKEGEVVKEAIAAALESTYGTKDVSATISKVSKQLGVIKDGGYWLLSEKSLLKRLLEAKKISA